MGGLESKGDHSQWTLSNLLGGKRSAICFLRSNGASWATTSSISADGRAGKEESREGEAQTTSSEPGLYLM